MKFTVPIGSRFAILALLTLVGGDALAQRPLRGLLNRPLLQRPLLQNILQPQLEIDLVAGEPYGVGRALIPLNGAEKDSDLQALAVVSDRAGRIVYPAYESAPIRQIIRDAIAAPQRATVYFLFRGGAPLELIQPVPQVIPPRSDPAAHAALLAQWWKQYASRESNLLDPDEGPSDVRDYLTWMLARRIGLPNPQAGADGTAGEAVQALGAITGSDAMRKRIVQETLASGGDAVANLPLPPPLAAAVLPPVPPNLDKTVVEPLAEHVPAECLYVRFGNFPNFLWLMERLDLARGQLQNFAFERGLDTDENKRLETQLITRRSALAKVLGPQVVADIAFIGFDTFQREGAALGVLLQAKNSAALQFDFSQQRAEALKKDPTIKEEKIQVGDLTASFLHTPDNRIRSIYVQDGDFHLLTNSRALAERFVEAGGGKRALSESPDFRAARQTMPLDRGLTAFIFLSEAFQRNLLDPHYQIEMIRRWRSSAEMQILQLARLAAQGEGAPSSSVSELIAGGFLPVGFGQRADGSRLVEADGQWLDSRRGRLGTFLPAPDTPVEGITPQESRRLTALYASYRQNFERFDPVLIGVQRTQGPAPGLERVIVDAQATPLADKHYQALSKWLGSPLEQRLAPVPGDQIAVQASLRGGTLLDTPEHMLFGALRDGDPAYGPSGLAGMLLPKMEFRGYIGAWPIPGLLALVPGSFGISGGVGPTDAAGYSNFLFGGWRRVFGPFTLMSFHREVLDEVAPQLRFEPATQPAQLWLRTADLGQAKLGGAVNRWGYTRAAHVSRGNAHFINSLTRQMNVPPEKALPIAEQLIGARFADPLGGKYELRPGPTGSPLWCSTKAPQAQFQAAPGAPPDYQLPLLKWLRSVNLEALMQPQFLLAHAVIDIPALEEVSGVAMPAMPAMPSLPFSLPGWGKPAEKQDSAPAEKQGAAPAENGPAAATPPPPRPAPPKRSAAEG